MKENASAFVKDNLILEPTGSGPLNGLTFAIKDVFEIENYKNTAGNPHWYHTHEPGQQHATVIESLLKNGARLQGTTHTDELMYSLNGENYHYGTPVNPRSPNRIPGGSSSGSAVAAASGLVDFAIGTDTGGSVRIPSSYCGIFGFRPTHGEVNMNGVIPLAKSLDTIGWMSQNLDTLLKVGEVLISNEEVKDNPFSHVYFAEEAWQLIDEENKEILLDSLKGVSKQVVNIAADGLAKWSELFRLIQGTEIWQAHGEWINEERPTFGPGIAERFQWTSTLNPSELPALLGKQNVIRGQLSSLLKEDGILVIPTAPGVAPLKNLPSEELEQYRNQLMQLTCIAGITGLPQVTIPFENKDGLPIGLSFIANHHQDIALIKWVREMMFAKRKVKR
ncbi:amidase [Cytobacillus sp. FSL K6-0129]|uniref:amidase n=1 Tax=Cytobacillus sp. FSL K6-0129 TaxID=2921421 RepID=UPI0030FAEA42